MEQGIRQRWREIRAVEMVLEEAKAELQGEDPLHFAIREKLEEAKRTVKELSEALMWAVGDDLPEPDESLLEGVRELLKRANG